MTEAKLCLIFRMLILQFLCANFVQKYVASGHITYRRLILLITLEDERIPQSIRQRFAMAKQVLMKKINIAIVSTMPLELW